MPLTAISFLPGQRWVSTTESELGLGIVLKLSNRRVELSFPAAAERRTYAIDNAPLSRVHYQVDEQVSSEDGQIMTIQSLVEKNGCLIYRGLSPAGEEVILPELHLNSFVQFSKPQDRLFAGQIDKNRAFQLRYETLEHHRHQQQSPVRGLLGPRVQLLPHQLYIASEAANRYAPRVLLADEVGLGKTIEAGLILHQQLITGRARRVMIVVPDSLLHQWLVEMLRRFNLFFTILDEDRCQGLEEPGEDNFEADSTHSDYNPFESTQLVLCTLSFLSENPVRQAQAVAAEWDLLVVDEAHHLQWDERQSSPAYRCIEALAGKARGLLLLTATPEQLGVESHFARLRLLDPDRYFDLQSFVDEELEYQPLNHLLQRLVAGGARELQQEDELTGQLKNYLGDQALKSLANLADNDDEEASSAILDEVVRDLLDRHGTGRVLFRNTRSSVTGFPERQLFEHPLTAPEIYRQNAADATIEQLLAPELILGESWVTEDPRVQWLEDFLVQCRGEKVLVICAHAATAIKLEEHLRLRTGTLSAAFHEGMSLINRDRAAAYFAEDEAGAQALVCSEIGSEGRNFQFAHRLVLFDLPLNPDLLEQRIGRLDRIGQHHTVQIHIPFYEASATAVLLRWYQDGIAAFERICPAGLMLFDHFEQELKSCLRQAGDEAAVDRLLRRTRRKTTKTLEALQQGRDRLLELNSFDQKSADEIVHSLVEEERRHQLSSYMERLFDEFGVEQEHHSANCLILRPGDHMQVHSFPALAEDGMTATYRRDLALAREDMQFLSWEHPMVIGAMDMVLSGEFGNTAFCTMKLAPLRAGTILLEAIFTLACTAPSDLQLTRYLPLTPMRVVIDSQFNDLSDLLSHALINKLSKKAPRSSARELVQHTRPKITELIGKAKLLAETRSAEILADAVTAMHAAQRLELQRLRALAAVNPNIRQQEIHFLESTAGKLQGYLAAAQVRLDAIRIVMVSES